MVGPGSVETSVILSVTVTAGSDSVTVLIIVEPFSD